ncbi:RrF2 family transcriptional regulator [Geothrix fermentans]|uniref:RrF2 family transcriptional regulator n=1 Tax=Geothrix fermentans TaxID=44676 RepID=UPI0004172575|nr:Rrf2 family transcriptional regulator [Geothrix fermentans]
MTSALYGAGAEYALHSLLILASRKEPVSVRDLARYQKLPERFLAKIFSRLKASRIVLGTEGISGGFTLARPAEHIPVLEVLEAVDPERALFACAEIRQNCALFEERTPGWAIAGSCRIHAFMQEAERKLKEVLASKTIADLACELSCKTPKTFADETAEWFQTQRRARRGAQSDPDHNPKGVQS